jgi:hypothetical protein
VKLTPLKLAMFFSELTIEVYREPHFTGYDSKTIVRAGDSFAPLAFPDAAVDVAELLKK